MSTVKKDPVLEAMARKLAGYDGVPVDERVNMLNRCAKAGRDAIQSEHGRNQSEMLVDIRELRTVIKNLTALDDRMNDPKNEDSGTYMGAYYAYYKGESKTWSAAKDALTKTEKYV